MSNQKNVIDQEKYHNKQERERKSDENGVKHTQKATKQKSQAN